MKKFFSLILSLLMASSVIVAVPVSATETEESGEILKAGTVSVSPETFTYDNPFPRGALNSNLFRIPGLITLQNGELLASSDARHTGVSDNGGHDVHAAISSDGGKTWHQSVVFQFVDSAQQMDTASTIMDACVVQAKDGTVFCMANFYPGGTDHAKNNPAPIYGSGFIEVNGIERLAITDNFANTFTEPSVADVSAYPYYVGDFVNGYANILKRSDNSATEYAIDGYFNIYYNIDGKYSITANGKPDLTQSQVDTDVLVQQNIFYEHSVLHACSTDYHVMMSSDDNGRSWSTPKFMDDVVYRKSTQGTLGDSYVITCPGSGLTTTSGDVILPIYCKNATTTAGNFYSSFIFSTDNGKTWERADDVKFVTMSSENQLIELPNGTVRMFFRNKDSVISYVDYTKTNGKYVVGSPKRTTQSVRSDCFISAIMTSHKTEDGRPIILASAPSDTTTRANGKIFAYALNDDSSMSFICDFSINTGWFAYSCITEREDGKIAILYEHNTAAYTYSVFDIEQLLGTVFVELSIGESYSDVIISETKRPVTLEPDKNIGTITNELVSIEHFIPLYGINSSVSNSLSSFSSDYDVTKTIETAEFTFTGSDTAWQIYNEATGYYLSNQSQASEFFLTAATTMKVVPSTVKDGTFVICRASGKRHIMFGTTKMHFDSSTYDETVDGYNLTLLEKQETISSSDTIPGYKVATTITSGKKYLITYQWSDGSYLLLYPINGTSNQTKLIGETTSVTKNIVTFTGVNFGSTYTVIDGVKYKIICHYDENDTVDNMPPRIEGVTDGAVFHNGQNITVVDRYLKSVYINGVDNTLVDTIPSKTESVTLTFDKASYNYTTLATGTGRDTSGIASSTHGQEARIYIRPEGVDGTGAIKWATSTMTAGVILGAANVAGSGMNYAYVLEPNRQYTVKFNFKHTAGNNITVSLIGSSVYEDVAGVNLASKTLATPTSNWDEHTFTFTTPSAEVLGEYKYLSFIITKPEEIVNYTALLDNLTIEKNIPRYTKVVTPQQHFIAGDFSNPEYTIVAEDVNGNKTTVSITVKPILKYDEAIKDFTVDTVTPLDKEKIVQAKEYAEQIDKSLLTTEEIELVDFLIVKYNALLEKISTGKYLCQVGDDLVYYNNGVIDTSNTLVKHNGIWHHVNGGKFVQDTTLVKYNGVYYYVKNGVKSTDNTLCKYNGVYYHVKGGKYVKDTTLVKYNSKWYYVENGVYVKKTALVKYGNTYYYVKNGVKTTTANTLVKIDGNWYHVKDGKWAKDTTLVKYTDGVYYYVKDGVKDTTANTLCKYNGVYYHVKGGKYVKDTTLVKYNGKWYYVKNGKFDKTFNGKALYGGKYYTVKNGVKV